MPEDFAVVARRHLEKLLEPGETLRGICAAAHQKVFSGSLYAIGVTDRRLLLQPLDRRSQPKGEARIVSLEAAPDAKLQGADEDWWSDPHIVPSLVLHVRATDGEKLKLRMMGGGQALFGGESA